MPARRSREAKFCSEPCKREGQKARRQRWEAAHPDRPKKVYKYQKPYVPLPIPVRRCQGCGVEYQARWRRSYCSDACASAAKDRKTSRYILRRYHGGSEVFKNPELLAAVDAYIDLRKTLRETWPHAIRPHAR
jgi:hypothetical protein